MMDWAEWFMAHAETASLKSKDPTQVGAALVSPDGIVRLTAFNGPPRGVRDVPERLERPAKYLYASHAEANLVAFAARAGIRTEHCTVYVTHPPCASCARTLIQAGIATIVCGSGRTSMPEAEFEAARDMLNEACVRLTSVETLSRPVPMSAPPVVAMDIDDPEDKGPDNELWG